MKEKDDCQICNGKNGGVKGNENIVDGIVMCDYCSAKRNKDGMSEQEIIIRWKQNDRYFASPSITNAMREWAEKHVFDMEWLGTVSDSWFKADYPISKSNVYRLRPDFELPEEPEFIEVEIQDVCGRLGFKCAGKYEDYTNAPVIKQLHLSGTNVSFYCYKYSSGYKTTTTCFPDSNGLVSFPVSVVFRKDAK